MNKKTWSTILVVVLIVAAAVGIYYATREEAKPAPTATPVVTDAPTAEPTAEPTDAPTAEPTEEPTAEPPADEVGGTGKVVLWHTFTEEQESSLQEIAKAYMDENPGVTVVIQSQPYEGFLDKVYNAVRTGGGPSFIINFSSEAAKYIDPADESKTFVVDFSQHMTAEELEAFKANLAGKLYDEAVGYEDGKFHSIPVYTSGPIFFYNKTMYDELGLKVPTTWAELESNSRAIKEKYGIPGFAADSLTDTSQILMMQNGSPYIDVANKKVLIDDPKAVERVQWLGDLMKEEVFATIPQTSKYFSSDFNAKLLASYLGSVAGYKYLTPDGFELGVAPTIMDGVAKWYPAWNRSAVAFKHGEEADKATVDFIRYLTNAENSVKFCMAVGSLTPYKDAAELQAYKDFLNKGDLMTDTLQAVQATLEYAEVLPIVTVSATVRSELQRAVERVANGEVTAEVALKEAAENANREWAAK